MKDCSRYLEQYLGKIYRRAKELAGKEMPVVQREQYEEYFRTGNRLLYERVYFARREFLTVFGLAAALWRDFRQNPLFKEEWDFIMQCGGRLLDIVEDILREPTWVLPAHGSMECFDGKKQMIDLFAAETAGSIGEILYCLKEFPFEECEGKRFEQLILSYAAACEKRILSVFEAKEPCDWWEEARMNWAAVCGANVVLTAYYMRKLDEKKVSCQRLLAVTERVKKTLSGYIEEIEQEEVCREGVGYYQYGMQYFLTAHEIFHDVLPDTPFSPSFENAAAFLPKMYLGGGRYVGFSDCTPEVKLNMGMACYLSRCYPGIRWSADYVQPKLLLEESLMESLGGEECHRWAGAYRDYIWVKKYGGCLTPGETAQEGVSFPKAQWHIQRLPGQACLVIKGGHNNESHNHNDVGSFSFWWAGTEIFCDLGSGEYCKDYFSEKRYQILCCSSEGHNVPIVDNKLQKPGEDCGCSLWKTGRHCLKMEVGQAYGRAAGDVVRQFDWGTAGVVGITDQFRAEDAEEVLVTRIKPVVRGNQVLLQTDAGRVEVEAAWYGESVEKTAQNRLQVVWRVEEKAHRNHAGEEEKVYLLKGACRVKKFPKSCGNFRCFLIYSYLRTEVVY